MNNLESQNSLCMIDEKNWEDFSNNGFLWFVNSMLHIFGWAIVYERNENREIIRVYPARVRFRGFSENTNTMGYQKISKYLVDNSEDLLQESMT
jgi:hypothetical protein